MARVREVLMVLAIVGCGSLLTYRPVRLTKAPVRAPQTRPQASSANAANSPVSVSAPATVREEK